MEKWLRLVGAAGIGLGLLAALLALGEQNFLLLPGGIALAVSGLLFVGFAQVISLLTDIRNALVPPTAPAMDAEGEPVERPAGWVPRTPAEMQLAIDQARAKQGNS